MMNPLRLAAVLVTLAIGVAAAGETAEEKVVFAETFSGELGKGWSWLREDAKDWRLDKGSLLVRTSTGSLWMKQNNNRNVLLRTPPKAPRFAFEVLVENEPTNGFEHAGLVWYADDDNYVALMKEKVGKVVVQLVSETDGRPKVGFAEKGYKEKAVWLRMEISGGKARGLFRTTGKTDWQALGQCDLPPAKGKVQIGLITGYAAGDAKNFSRFSSFRVLEESK
jgi:regulation of enolase protein 1 (concanavalin A-like superfamily)